MAAINVTLSGGPHGGEVLSVEIGTWMIGEERVLDDGYGYTRVSADQAVLSKQPAPPPPVV